MANRFLDFYSRRIRYSQTPGVNPQALRELHLLHLQHIPYENIDVSCHQVDATGAGHGQRPYIQNMDLIEGGFENRVVMDVADYLDNPQEHLGVELDQSELFLLKPRFAALKRPGC